ncbi:hypothetical protein E1B28_009685 [Marasmius oreades]|uniref:Protein kinase domain-containing protein n=1 Tax=Marasmius oreades TaxID=181124 RepID=A0A9P7RW69_9AGAR|nr:uncharacterized protein E1B28_009685 [Marasmius oreades]KAG7090578.1 hypothetical protein E1B28_009685 [Marasmius oreades]
MTELSMKSDTIKRRCSFRSDFKPYTDDPPSIEIDQFDASPFSESFSGMLGEDELLGTESRTANIHTLGPKDVELSFNVEQITDIKEIDPEWDDEEIDELLVLSPKMPNRLSTIMKDLQELDKRANSISTLSDFDLISESKDGTGICLVRKRGTKQTYTMKRFKTSPSHAWPLELNVLEMINDREAPFLPKICWRVFEEGCFSLIMKSYPGGSLLHFVEQNGPLPRLHATLYASELVEALSVIHAAGIQHRNISPACIMIDATGHIVLVGFEHTCVETEHTLCASGAVRCAEQEHKYQAPELLLGWTHDYAVDCWGFGCVLYFMMYGLHPFPVGIGGCDWRESVIRGQVSYLDQGEQVACELMSACMEPNPAFRMDILEIKGHDFFACVNWSLVHEKNVEVPYIPLSDSVAAMKDKSASTISIETVRKPISISTTTPQCSSSEWDAQTQTPAPAYSVKASPSMFSSKARQEVQDSLPSIFRIGHEKKLDEPKPLYTRSRSSTVETTCSLDPVDMSNVDYTALPSPAPTYDSLRRRLDCTPSLTQEERMARFWESLDDDMKMKTPDMARCSGELPYLPRSLVFSNKLRKKFDTGTGTASRSMVSLSLVGSSTQRLSQLITGKFGSPSSLQRARVLRKHEVSPSPGMLVVRSDTVDMEDSKLPQGLEHIGSGIGFTYRPPAIPLPISDAISRSKIMRPISGIGIRFGRKVKVGGRKSTRWGVSETNKKEVTTVGVGCGRNEESETMVNVVIGRLSSSSFIRVGGHGQKSSLESGRGRCSVDREPQHDVDVFRVGLLPEVVSPVTETESTVNNSPFADMAFFETDGNGLMGSETLKGLYRDHGVQSTLRLVP